MRISAVFAVAILMLLCNCTPKPEKQIGSIERLHPDLDNVVSKNATIEVLAEGFDWSEGPLWLDSYNMLLFTDVPKNIVYKWTKENGAEIYLTPSGFTGTETNSREPGANGLALDDEGYLVLCQHGDRRLAIMNAPIEEPEPDFITLADNFNGSRFNSPNDVVFYNYSFYFTDPPYGLAGQANDPEKEIPFQGVYEVTADGEVNLLVDSITRPNGLAFTPDGNLIIANSDPARAKWYIYEFGDNTIASGKIYYDATSLVGTIKGLPDGLKIDSRGNVFATGPGGVFIFNPAGVLIGKINLKEASANCALSGDEKTLYITNHMYLLRVRLRD